MLQTRPMNVVGTVTIHNLPKPYKEENHGFKKRE